MACLSIAQVSDANNNAEFKNLHPIDRSLTQTPFVHLNGYGTANTTFSIQANHPGDNALLINGLSLHHPYSGLYNLQNPLLTYLFTTPERVVGSGISIESQNIESHRQATISSGYPNQYGGAISAHTQIHENVLMGGFLKHQYFDDIDYNENSLESTQAGLVAQYATYDQQIDFAFGHESRRYDTTGFYGAPLTESSEEKTENSTAVFSFLRGDLEDIYFRATANWHQFNTQYANSTGLTNKDIDAQLASFMMEGQTIEIQHVALKLWTEIKNESRDEGNDSDDRTQGSILLLPKITFDHFRITAGLSSQFYTDLSPDYLPQAKLDFFLNDNTILHASYMQQAQRPDYYDLHYNDSNHQANPNLPTQKTASSELGITQYLSSKFDWNTALFHRRIKGASDWVKFTPVDFFWQSTDLGTLDVTGVEVAANYASSESLSLSAHYQWATKDDYDFYAALYELDYPEHLLNLTAQWKFTSKLQFIANQSFSHQTENDARNGRRTATPANLTLLYTPKSAKNTQLSLTANNIWGSTFEPVPLQAAAKRNITAEISITW